MTRRPRGSKLSKCSWQLEAKVLSFTTPTFNLLYMQWSCFEIPRRLAFPKKNPRKHAYNKEVVSEKLDPTIDRNGVHCVVIQATWKKHSNAPIRRLHEYIRGAFHRHRLKFRSKLFFFMRKRELYQIRADGGLNTLKNFQGPGIRQYVTEAWRQSRPQCAENCSLPLENIYKHLQRHQNGIIQEAGQMYQKIDQ